MKSDLTIVPPVIAVAAVSPSTFVETLANEAPVNVAFLIRATSKKSEADVGIKLKPFGITTAPRLVDFTTYPDTANGTRLPYSGLIRLTYDGGWKDETQIEFKQELPYPMGLSGLVTKIEISED